ncbi:hypothetical protein PYCC9005_000103 [Savitreella phatthalungensis]
MAESELVLHEYRIGGRSTTTTLPDSLLQDCLSLVETNLADAYAAASSWGWSASAKLREMQTRGLHYLCLSTGTDLAGFASYKVTTFGTPKRTVVFLYELQIARAHQSRGLGGTLMDAVEKAAVERAVEGGRTDAEVCLCVFNANAGARRFYERRGYTQVAEDEGEDAGPDARYLHKVLASSRV